MDRLIEEGVKVDCILTDVPYGTTKCKWDNIIPFEPMWERLNKLIKPNGAIVLFGSQPFTTDLINSNRKNYKYDWIWQETKPQGFLNAKKMPLKGHENISVFYKKLPTYNPQGVIKIDKIVKNGGTKDAKRSDRSARSMKLNGDITASNGSIKNEYYKQEYTNYPTQILKFSNGGNKQLHPTQKPTDLLEYLIKTYTNENETVLDFTMGSGSTGVACMNTNRKFIGIELDENYFNIAKDRIENSIKNK